MTVHIWTESRAYGLACAAVLGILVFTSLVPAHSQSGPKPKLGMRLAQAGQTQSPPVQAPEPQPIWGLNCAGTLKGLDCLAVQQVPIARRARVIVVVRMPPDTDKPVMVLRVPAGIHLPAGLKLQFGQNPAKQVPLRTCEGASCRADYAVTDAEIASMIQGQPILISLEDGKRRPLSVDVPSTGFAAAYAKMKK
jgi:invasion protein IalB